MADEGKNPIPWFITMRKEILAEQGRDPNNGRPLVSISGQASEPLDAAALEADFLAAEELGAAVGGESPAAASCQPAADVGGELGVAVGGKPPAAIGDEPGAACGGELGIAVGGEPPAAVASEPSAAAAGQPVAAVGGEPGAAVGGEPGAAVSGELGAAVGGEPGAAVSGELGAAFGDELGVFVDELDAIDAAVRELPDYMQGACALGFNDYGRGERDRPLRDGPPSSRRYGRDYRFDWGSCNNNLRNRRPAPEARMQPEEAPPSRAVTIAVIGERLRILQRELRLFNVQRLSIQARAERAASESSTAVEPERVEPVGADAGADAYEEWSVHFTGDNPEPAEAPKVCPQVEVNQQEYVVAGMLLDDAHTGPIDLVIELFGQYNSDYAMPVMGQNGMQFPTTPKDGSSIVGFCVHFSSPPPLNLLPESFSMSGYSFVTSQTEPDFRDEMTYLIERPPLQEQALQAVNDNSASEPPQEQPAQNAPENAEEKAPEQPTD